MLGKYTLPETEGENRLIVMCRVFQTNDSRHENYRKRLYNRYTNYCTVASDLLWNLHIFSKNNGSVNYNWRISPPPPITYFGDGVKGRSVTKAGLNTRDPSRKFKNQCKRGYDPPAIFLWLRS